MSRYWSHVCFVSYYDYGLYRLFFKSEKLFERELPILGGLLEAAYVDVVGKGYLDVGNRYDPPPKPVRLETLIGENPRYFAELTARWDHLFERDGDFPGVDDEFDVERELYRRATEITETIIALRRWAVQTAYLKCEWEGDYCIFACIECLTGAELELLTKLISEWARDAGQDIEMITEYEPDPERLVRWKIEWQSFQKRSANVNSEYSYLMEYTDSVVEHILSLRTIGALPPVALDCTTAVAESKATGVSHEDRARVLETLRLKLPDLPWRVLNHLAMTDQPQTGKEICAALAEDTDVGTLTSHVIPKLKQYGLQNTRGSGYWIDWQAAIDAI